MVAAIAKTSFVKVLVMFVWKNWWLLDTAA